MSTLLMTVFAIFFVIAALATGFTWWLRAKVRKGANDVRKIAPLLIEQTPRMRLVEFTPDMTQDTSALDELWAKLAAQGAEKRGTFATADGKRRYIAGDMPAHQIVAMVVQIDQNAPYCEFLAIASANSVRVLTGQPGARSVKVPSLKIAPHPAPMLDTAIAAFPSMPPGEAFDKATLMMLIERVYAARMDVQLVHPPTLQEMRKHAKAHGGMPDVTPDQLQHALELNRAAWQVATRSALLDNARATLNLGEEAWRLLQNDLIVVHQEMAPDEVIATLTEHPLVERLGAQLKRQDFAPMQIFEEINSRLDQNDQRELVLKVAFPVPSQMYARGAILQALGVKPAAMAA